jgi:hypothetical protein
MSLTVITAGCGSGSGSSATAGGTSAGSAPGSRSSGEAVASWTVTRIGWGPIRVGMTVDEARAAIGDSIAEPRNSECDHVHPSPAPPGVLLMIVDGRVARAEVSDTTVATAEGARVGDSEARIDSLYAGRVQRTPHKYVDGNYLIVRGLVPADTLHRLVFETDGRRVTQFRGGRLPEVEWVEGCG